MLFMRKTTALPSAAEALPGRTQPIPTECDAERFGMYLGNSDATNTSFHGRHGFRESAEADMPEGTPPDCLNVAAFSAALTKVRCTCR